MTPRGLHTAAGETMTTSSLETSSGTLTSASPVTMTTRSLEPSSGTLTSASPVTMTTRSLEPSSGTSGLPVTMTTSSLETSDVTSGPPITMATSSLETPTETSGSPISRVKILIMSTPAISTNEGGGPAQSSDQKTKNTLTVAVLVALLAVIVLLALVLLWRRRQKRRTGALTLNRGGKHNGVADAWAGPARVADEEAVMTAAAGARKSRQGSVALEELKAEPAASLPGEEEPLVGSEDGAVEAPASDGPEAGDVEVP
ncbi:hypothetical protein QTO34_013252 [Cnephaeus nilssonii]|uniref:Leukosialin n=1 Tax=Cnephaeus nilssonii TaxID=3371016 RepID=A0AA40I8U6_CNENI|nr:hypothetical protein QTO34_013252 [Eptesicus nilssonii]